jgi:hypothetical protein
MSTFTKVKQNDKKVRRGLTCAAKKTVIVLQIPDLARYTFPFKLGPIKNFQGEPREKRSTSCPDLVLHYGTVNGWRLLG